MWAADPDRSPTTLAAADSRLRCHLRPRFGRRRLGELTVSSIRQWQYELRGKELEQGTAMACRSLLNRTLQAAEDAGTGLRAGSCAGCSAYGSISGAGAWRSRPSATTPAGLVAATNHAPKSTAGIRSIPRRLVVEELRRRRPAEPSSLLFPDASRYRMRHAYLRALGKARVHGHLLGLDLRGPHYLRHTFATWLDVVEASD